MTIKNTCGVSPMGKHILVCVEKVEEVTKGGVILPDKAVDAQKFEATFADVVEVGPSALHTDDFHPDENLVPGDRVMFHKFAGRLVVDNDEGRWVMLEDRDVIGVCHV